MRLRKAFATPSRKAANASACAIQAMASSRWAGVIGKASTRAYSGSFCVFMAPKLTPRAPARYARLSECFRRPQILTTLRRRMKIRVPGIVEMLASDKATQSCKSGVDASREGFRLRQAGPGQRTLCRGHGKLVEPGVEGFDFGGHHLQLQVLR